MRWLLWGLMRRTGRSDFAFVAPWPIIDSKDEARISVLIIVALPRSFLSDPTFAAFPSLTVRV